MGNLQSLWTTTDVLEFLKISPSKFAYLRAMGLMVPPITQLGRSLRFHPREVRAWACSGGPSVTEWEAIKKRRGWIFSGENL
jgi:hypothetical protein